MKRVHRVVIWSIVSVFSVVTLLILDWAGGATIARYYIAGQSPENLSFSFRGCDENNVRVSSRVVSSEWNNGQLIVKGVVYPNCAATWLFGGYETVGNELLLSYSAVEFGAMACECATEVRYEIGGLDKAVYDVTISEGPPLEYVPLTYQLFN